MSRTDFRFHIMVLAAVVQYIKAYHSGAPPGACLSMAPNPNQHGAEPQTGDSPYRVYIDKSYYGPNVTVKVTVKSCGEEKILGVLIQARKKGNDMAMGSFTMKPVKTQYLSCQGAETKMSVVTHSERLNTKMAEFEWMASSNTTGSIYFMATVVQNRKTYWVKLMSAEVKQMMANQEMMPPKNPSCDKMPNGSTKVASLIASIFVLPILSFLISK